MSSEWDVLVIDDEEDIREFYYDVLEESALFRNVILAKDGADGFRRLSNQMFNLIIVDLTMPRMNGLKFIQNVKSPNTSIKHKGVREIPIIIISGDINAKVAQESIKMGVKNILIKPFTGKSLIKKVRESLNLPDE